MVLWLRGGLGGSTSISNRAGRAARGGEMAGIYADMGRAEAWTGAWIWQSGSQQHALAGNFLPSSRGRDALAGGEPAISPSACARSQERAARGGLRGRPSGLCARRPCPRLRRVPPAQRACALVRSHPPSRSRPSPPEAPPTRPRQVRPGTAEPFPPTRPPLGPTPPHPPSVRPPAKPSLSSSFNKSPCGQSHPTARRGRCARARAP